MPKLISYRETVNATVWDAFSPTMQRGRPEHGTAPGLMVDSVYGPDPRVTMFRISNIGVPHLTNMQVAGQLSQDLSFYILNWYARTNIPDALQAGRPDASPFARAWYAWANATIASIVVGCMPIVQTPLAELLGPLDAHARLGGHQRPTAEADARERLAKRMYESFCASVRKGSGDPGQASWEDLDDLKDGFGDIRAHWLAAADATKPIRIPLIVPIRQNFHVTIETNRQALQAMQEVMPRDIAPQALVWVHLEGVTSREVQ